MKKIPNLFTKNPENLGLVINEINPKSNWILNNTWIATRKFDGTACAIINGNPYKRLDIKVAKGMIPPANAIPCQEADSITGHHPHWIPITKEDKANKYFWQAYELLANKEDGTYELIGEKVQSNPEKIKGHQLVKHGVEVLEIKFIDFNHIKEYLTNHDIEGIVFYSTTSNDMCKVTKKNFNIKR